MGQNKANLALLFSKLLISGIFYYCALSLLTFIDWFLICKVFWKQPWILKWHYGFAQLEQRPGSPEDCLAGAEWREIVCPGLWLREFKWIGYGWLWEYRSFCFPILDLEYAFLTFISHLQKIFGEYNMKMWKEEKGKEEISHWNFVYIFVNLLFVPVKWSRSWMKRVTSAASFPSSRSSMSIAVFAAVPLSHFLSTASDSVKTASITSARAAVLTRRRRRLGFAVSASKRGKGLLFSNLCKAVVAWPELFPVFVSG